ncbi:dephospho-CoA kinase [Alteromonas sp. C1M14]|uniref:dephospho-CoA kinase n=1 Tax=Alteromonas sp. C1M14 TaxID=2841567 RepID=UPI001C09B05A|nr:dephospho-CoA kinase [Alteromonas sp. C1M14]MBU2979401.1 dephospho-CoA kinase [Alteromonas sp. C1M14]
MSTAFVVGLTGGIGSGKSAVSDLFAKLGIDVVDADIVAREVVAPGRPALNRIVRRFGSDIVNNDGHLNRAKLRQIVFDSAEHKQWLNDLLHPAIRQAMGAQLAQSTTPYVIFSVPLLIENKLDTMTNRVLVVDCDERTQLTRALARDGSNETTIRAIMASQATRAERLAKADDVIDNNGSLSSLPAKVEQLHQQYLRLSAD